MDDVVYQELRRIAGAYFKAQHPGTTLQPTALVHEVYLRLFDRDPERYRDRRHFIAVAALAMRQILTDQARRRAAQKRGGTAQRITLDSAALSQVRSAADADAAVLDVLAVDDALVRLAALSPRQARIVELQFFGGLTAEETATSLDISLSLVEKEWRRARAWMQRELSMVPG